MQLKMVLPHHCWKDINTGHGLQYLETRGRHTPLTAMLSVYLITVFTSGFFSILGGFVCFSFVVWLGYSFGLAGVVWFGVGFFCLGGFGEGVFLVCFSPLLRE